MERQSYDQPSSHYLSNLSFKDFFISYCEKLIKIKIKSLPPWQQGTFKTGNHLLLACEKTHTK